MGARPRSRLAGLLALTSAVAGLLLAPASVDAAATLRIEHFRLRNGLEVVLHPDPRAVRAAVNILYRVGSASEASGRHGLAHLFEHLMFMGTRRIPAKQIDLILERAGGWSNAYTTEDVTVYYEVGPAALLETMLWIEADRMASLPAAMTEAKLGLQRKVVLNELRQNYLDAPYGVAGLTLPGLVFPAKHPYSWPVIGTAHELRALRLPQLRQFFRRFYSPRNAALVVAGPFEPQKMRRLVERLFGWIPAAAPPASIAIPAPPPRPTVRRVVRDRVRLSRLYLSWLSPALYRSGDAEVELLATILAGGKQSRLQRALMFDRRLASDVSAYQDGRRLAGQLVVDVTLRAGVSRRRVERIVARVIAELRRRPPTAGELLRARNRLETAFVLRLEKLRQRADLLNQYLAFAGRPDYLAEDLARYRRVTPASLLQWARRVLDPRRRSELWVLPKESAKGTKNAKGKVASSAPALSRPVASQPVSKASATSAPAAGAVLRAPAWMDRRPPLGTLRPPQLPTIRRISLSNGMPVYVVQKRDLPLVQLRLVLRTGLVDDRRPGVAYLTAALLAEGAGRRGALAFAGALDQLGARLRTSCFWASTSVNLRVLARHLDAATALLADVVRRPRLDASAFGRVRGRLRAWARQRRSDPLALADLALASALHGGALFGRPRLPLPSELRRLTLAAVRRFHRRTYGAERAYLLVAGDVTLPMLRRVLERHFGNWRPRHPRVPALRAELAGPASTVHSPRLVLVDVPKATQAVLRVGRLLPAGHGKRSTALSLLAMVLGGSFTSRLNQSLRERHGYTYGARAAAHASYRHGLLRISTSVAAKHTLRALVEIERQLAGLRARSIGKQELAKGRRLLWEEIAERGETTAGVLELIDGMVRYDLPLDHLKRRVDELGRLDAAAVQAIARQQLQAPFVLTVVGDLSRFRAALQQRFGKAQLHGKDGLPLPTPRSRRR